MKKLLVLPLFLLAGCYYDVVAVDANGNLNCTYQGNTVYSGSVEFSGMQSSLFSFDGTWKINRVDGAECTITLKAMEK